MIGTDNASNATLTATAAVRTVHTGSWPSDQTLPVFGTSAIESLHAVAAMKAVSARAGAASSVGAQSDPA